MVQVWDGCSRILWREPKEDKSHRGRYFARTQHTNRFHPLRFLVITFHISVDDKVYVDLVHNNHIYEVPANSGWVWLGDPWYPYTNPDFQIRRLYYGPRTEAQKYGLLNWKNKFIHVSYVANYVILTSET